MLLLSCMVRQDEMGCSKTGEMIQMIQSSEEGREVNVSEIVGNIEHLD